MPNKGWLTKGEAAKRLGVSVRTLERYAAAGRVQSGKRDSKLLRNNRRIGIEAVYDAESIAALKRELTGTTDVVLDEPKAATSLVTRQHPDVSIGEVSSQLVEILKTAFVQASIAALPPVPARIAKEPPAVPIADKLSLSLREAAALAGYSRAYLLDAIRAGTLRAAKRAGKWNIMRPDLDKWMKRLRDNT